MKKSSLITYALCLALPLAIGGISGYFTTREIPVWFASLNKPSFNPPSAVFAPVWTTLYILMGISCAMIFSMPDTPRRSEAIRIYFVQLILNSLWSFLFFYFHQIGAAIFDIALLWLAIVIMIKRFNGLNSMAALINIPYLLWVSFATALNIAFYILN